MKSASSDSFRQIKQDTTNLQFKIIRWAGLGVQIMLFCLVFLNSHMTLREVGLKPELQHEIALVVVSLLVNVIFQVHVINGKLAQVRRQLTLG